MSSNNQSAGNMLQGAVKNLFAATLKILALIVAWLFEMAGRILFWISEQIKRNAK